MRVSVGKLEHASVAPQTRFQALVGPHVARLVRFACRRVGNPADAEDGSACQQDSGLNTTAPSMSQSSATITGRTSATATGNRSTNGAAGQMPAYYEGQLFTVNMKEGPDPASTSLIAQNGSINEIYASNDLDEEQELFPVIDAIQGEGFNPLRRQNLIVFNQGFTPHQFVSAEAVEAAAAGPNPEITIVETDEVYRCSVVGQK
jgi:hypothetical protein